MDTYSVDLEAEQIVRWLIQEHRAGRSGLQITASRSYLVEAIPSSQSQRRRLGDEELEDLSEVTAVGTLEISPSHANEGWVLRVRVEDPLGARLPEEISVSDAPEEIDLEGFQAEFIQTERGSTFVSVDAETPHAFALCQKLLADIEADKYNA